MAQQTLLKGRWQEINLPRVDLGKLKDGLQSGIDSLVEYPGSVKGDYGRWVPTEWLTARLERILAQSGTERK